VLYVIQNRNHENGPENETDKYHSCDKNAASKKIHEIEKGCASKDVLCYHLQEQYSEESDAERDQQTALSKEVSPAREIMVRWL
jgi:hypothetical protein